MKYLKTLGFALLATTALSSCAGIAKVEKSPGADLSKYKTYTWVDEDANDANDYVTIEEQKLQALVASELAKVNWKEKEANADLLLKTDVVVEKTVRESSDPVYSRPFTRPFFNPYTRRVSYVYFPSQFVGYDNRAYEAREGKLTLTMIDAKTDKVVWQGVATDDVNGGKMSSKDIERSVKAIMRKFQPEMK